MRIFTLIGAGNLSGRPRVRFLRAVLCFALAGIACSTSQSWADEGGTSFWLPGIFGSLAAVPSQPGWSLTAINYYTNVSAGGNVALAREFDIGKIPGNLSASINASLHADADIVLLTPAYTFATPCSADRRRSG